jgi:amino acid permease
MKEVRELCLMILFLIFSSIMLVGVEHVPADWTFEFFGAVVCPMILCIVYALRYSIAVVRKE